ncbi:hypothetical protein [Pseudoalteromonas phenolica]|uniref:hypothetical protein n=1 Tax=Pseudoalteromonas phenolica TaxID=161398 RepID=UPI00384B1EE3
MSVTEQIEALKIASAEQTLASQALAQEMETKIFKSIQDLESQSADAINRVNSAIQEINTAIPTSVEKMLHQKIYIDPDNGDDANTGNAKATPKRTLKSVIDNVPDGATVAILANPGTTLTIDEPIIANNKNIVFFISDLSLVFNERIELYRSTLKCHYMLVDIVQNTSFAIYHFSSDIYLTAQNLKPTAGNLGFTRQNYASGFLTNAGTYTSNVAFQFSVSDMPDTYHIFSRPTWFASMIASLHSLTLGANVALFDPAYESIQVGTKGVYLVGA